MCKTVSTGFKYFITILSGQYNSILLLALILTGYSTSGFSQSVDSMSYIVGDNEYNLVVASLRGDYDNVVNLLNKDVSANLVLEESISPLAYAAQGGHLRVAKLLIDKGAEINLRPKNGHTPLISAARHKQYNMVDFLIQKGALVNLPNDLGRSAFLYASANGDSAMVAKLVKEGANVSQPDTMGCTPLFAAVSQGHYNIVHMLVSLGASVSTPDKSGVTPFMMAVARHDYQMMEILLNYGANINAITQSKQTALTIAIEDNDEQLVQYLVTKGANTSQNLTFAETPLTVANYLSADPFIIENIQEAGARENIWPDFRKFFIGPLMAFNNNDFFSGLHLGIKDYKYDLDISTGFLIRPYAPRILVKNGNIYNQFWERRSYVYIGFDKHFMLQQNRYKHRQGVFVGYKQLFSFAEYRGVASKPSDILVYSPEAGVYYATKRVQVNFSYAYTDFGKEGVAPHKINLSVRLLLGNAFNFSKENYSTWD